MGVRPLKLDDWIEFGADRTHQLAEKARLLRDERPRVLQTLSSADDACQELRSLVAETIGARPTNEHPLAEVGLWTQEDWAILSPSAPVTLEAACICFPSRWSLDLKIGRGSDEIHEPVPSFASIAKPTKNFLERLHPDKPMWRLNWTIHDSDQLFSPGPHPTRNGWEATGLLENTFLRLEKQSLRKLPRTGYASFAIRTFTYKMSEVTRQQERLRLTLESLEKLDAATVAYKGMASFHSALVTTLRNAT